MAHAGAQGSALQAGLDGDLPAQPAAKRGQRAALGAVFWPDKVIAAQGLYRRAKGRHQPARGKVGFNQEPWDQGGPQPMDGGLGHGGELVKQHRSRALMRLAVMGQPAAPIPRAAFQLQQGI